MKAWERELARLYGLVSCGRCGELMDAARESDNCDRCERTLSDQWIAAERMHEREQKRIARKAPLRQPLDDIVKRVFARPKMEPIREGSTWPGVTTWNEAREATR